MNRYFVFVSIIFCLSTYSSLKAESRQDTIHITLNDAIIRAATQSVDAVVAKSEYKSAYWEYRTYQSELLPEVMFNGTLPYYSKSYNQYQQSDGTYTFVSNDYRKIDAGLSVNQSIPLTGGSVSVESGMEQLKQYGDNSNTSWKTIPVGITFQQPILGFNSLAWKKKIMPIKKNESESQLVADIEDVSNSAVTYYFNLLLGKSNLDIAHQNMENTEKLYKIAEARNKIGQLSESDLMQLKISMLNAETNLIDAQSSLNARMFELRSFLGYEGDIVLEPELPSFIAEEIPSIQYDKILDLANKNNAFTKSVRRQMLEASRDVNKAKADRWDISVFASFGRIGQDERFSNTFKSDYMRNSQVIEVGIKIPILDWGKRKGQIKIAESNREVLDSKLQKETRDFNQNIFLTVLNFNNQPQQFRIAKETDIVAQKRYETSVETFIMGKIDILNLNDAQAAKDVSRRNYIEQLFHLWSYYYQIRSLTLFDFIADKPLMVNYEKLVSN